MLRYFLRYCVILLAFFGLFSTSVFAEVNPKNLLKPQQAFIPKLSVKQGVATIQFTIAPGYYLYRNKIHISSEPSNILGEAQFSLGEEKEDEFFGKQEIYYHMALINLPLKQADLSKFRLIIKHQGCADAGICYPPTQSVFSVNGDGVYVDENALPANPKSRFLQPAPEKKTSLNPNSHSKPDKTAIFNISWDTLSANLLAFFIAGLGLSFTACMYPLIPIVSGIIVGHQSKGNLSKKRAFLLSFIYVQGLALTYTAVGVLAGLSGALLTVWLQQAWVVLSASVLMLLLALSMFGLFSIQMPSVIQQYFSNKSSHLVGGKFISVFLMGMFSALIVGPCVAPPLAFALAYIGQSGDGVLGGLALYFMALGTGVPLILVAVFGAHLLPRAGAWMKGVQIFFGCMLLAVAVYLATPFIARVLVIAAYSLILLIPGGLLLSKIRHFSGSLKVFSLLLGLFLVSGSLYFAYNSTQNNDTVLHHFLTLNTPQKGQQHGQHFSSQAALQTAIDQAFAQDKNQVVYVDFYADWCISCKEMAAYTFSQPEIWRVMNEKRFFQIDVTENNPDHQKLLKDYGLYGPPGLFVLYSPDKRSQAMLGFMDVNQLTDWLAEQKSTDAVSLPH